MPKGLHLGGAIVYFIILFLLLSGFTWMNAIGAYVAAMCWMLICGIAVLGLSKWDAEKWEERDGRS